MDEFRQISDCLPAWLIAEGQKRTASAKHAAKFQGDNVMQGGEPEVGNRTACPPTIGRSIATARPTRIPTSAVVIDLVMYREKGGRTTQGRKLDRPAYRDGSWRERARETGLRVVSG